MRSVNIIPINGVKCYITLLLIISAVQVVNGKNKKIFALDAIRVCNKSMIAPTAYMTLAIVGKSKIAISINVTIPYTVDEFDLMLWSQYKCNTPNADMGSCEFLIQFPIKKPCHLVNSKGHVWNHCFDAFSPKVSCPLKKGNYVLDKYQLDNDKILNLFGNNLQGDYYFLARGATYVNNNALFHCFELIFHLASVRID